MASRIVSTCVFAVAVALAASMARADCSNAVMAGSFPMSVDGQAVTGYLAVAGGTKEQSAYTTSSGYSVKHDGRTYVASRCATEFAPDMYMKVPLLGKSISVNISVASATCGCNVAFYLVSMPANVPTKCEDYYCDANSVCGVACAEMDLFEANKAAFQVTPHKCSDGATGTCDGDGCGHKAQDIPNAYGSGSQFTINTEHEFNVKTSFVESGGQLQRIETQLSQPGGKTITLVHDDSSCPAGYVGAMTTPLQLGMVITSSFWGSDANTMKWLDEPPCNSQQNCQPTSPINYEGIVVASL